MSRKLSQSKSGDPKTPSKPERREQRELHNEELDQVSGGNTGSQSTGAGAGKVTFNPFSITRKIDKSSPLF